jgi:hypothetical protein
MPQLCMPPTTGFGGERIFQYNLQDRLLLAAGSFFMNFDTCKFINFPVYLPVGRAVLACTSRNNLTPARIGGFFCLTLLQPV